MKTKNAMKKQGLVYFSALSGTQKDKVIQTIRVLKNGLSSIPEGLAKQILNSRELDVIIKESDYIYKKLKGKKCFKHENKYYPLNIKEIINF